MQKKILVVDDDEMVLNLSKFFLEDSSLNLKVETISDPTKAAELIKNNKIKPDVILVDIKMPQESGLDTIKRLKEIPEIGKSNFSVYSTTADPDLVLKAKKNDVGYIIKDFENLVKNVEKLINGHYEYPCDL